VPQGAAPWIAGQQNEAFYEFSNGKIPSGFSFWQSHKVLVAKGAESCLWAQP
jgi:hypothetical protein